MSRTGLCRLQRSANLAAVAELAWLDGDRLGSAVRTPLVAEGAPVFALPYAERDVAAGLARAGQAALVLSDVRLARKGWEPLGATVTVEVSEDRDGAAFLDGLLHQELLKHPPSRALIDTPLLRREHWWYVPRLLVRVTGVARLRPVGRRDRDEAVLAYAAAGEVDADTVALTGAWEGDRVGVVSLAGRDLAAVEGATAALLRHDLSVPDRERTSAEILHGRLRGGVMTVTGIQGALALPPPAGLRARLRRVAALRRACERNLPG